MTDKAISPLRRRLIEDMAIRRLGPKTQLHYIRHVKRFADFLGRSAEKATTEDVHRYQLWLASIGTTVPTVNVSATALRFFFKVTLKRRHSLAQPSRAVARMVAGGAQEGMDASRPAVAVSRLPRAAHERAPASSARSPGRGTRRHYQARRCPHPAAQFCHPSPGAKDRYPDHPSSARSRDILPANILSRGGFTTRSIPGAARPC